MITLLPDEKIVFEGRRHWLPITVTGIFYGIAGIIPILFPFMASLLEETSRAAVTPLITHDLYWFFVAAWLFFLWMFFFIPWTNYYLDVLIITNKRVIDIEQKDLFSRDFAEIRIENIEDIRVDVIGILPSLLNFGVLHLQSAGESREFIIKYIPDPHAVRELISKQHDARMGTR